MPGRGEETQMPWMWMPFRFYPQNKKRRGNYARKESASFARNKVTSHKTALRRSKTLARNQPKYAQLVRQKMRKSKMTAQPPCLGP
jgi:hypothetical protein